jgi:hypothetical protein
LRRQLFGKELLQQQVSKRPSAEEGQPIVVSQPYQATLGSVTLLVFTHQVVWDE